MAGTDELNALAAALTERMSLPDGPVAVALSGGADSAALLWLTARALPDVVAIHVFHGLAASSLMSTAAGQIAAKCGVRMEMAIVQPAGDAEHHLRDARLAALAERAGDRPVLFGHTLEDQAETVLHRVLRGTGVEGLSGIAPRRGRISHPMLRVRRADARHLAELAGLPFRDDPANSDPGVLRNRIRGELLPLADEVMGRDVTLLLARLADDARAVTDRSRRRVRFETDGRRVRVPLGELRADADVNGTLRDLLVAWRGPYPPDRAALERLGAVVFADITATDVGDGVRAYRSDGFLILEPAEDNLATTPDPEPVVSGTTQWGGWRFDVAEVDGPTVVPLSLRRLLVPGEAGQIAIRMVSGDDTITGRRVSEALADAHVPADLRNAWPVITCDGVPVWAPGARRQVWPGHAPGRYLSISAYQEPAWQTFER